MLETIGTRALALGAEALDMLQAATAVAWTWLQAQPLWLGIAVAVGGIVAVLIVGGSRRQPVTLRSGRTAPRSDGKTRQSRPARQPLPSRRQAPMPASAQADMARDLIGRGVPTSEIARQTGLSHDAVSLLVSRAMAATARQVRPEAARLADQSRWAPPPAPAVRSA